MTWWEVAIIAYVVIGYRYLMSDIRDGGLPPTHGHGRAGEVALWLAAITIMLLWLPIWLHDTWRRLT